MRKLFYIFIIIQTVCLANDSSTYWHSKLPDNWDVYYMITKNSGQYSGKFVTYLNGMQFAGDNMGNIKITQDSISMITNMNANILYKGKFNSNRDCINGANYYTDGSTLKIILNKVDDSIAKTFFPRSNKNLSPIQKMDDGIPISTFEDVGWSRYAAEVLIKDIVNEKVGEIHAVLLAKDGKLVIEEYFYDNAADKTHRLHSCTKSILSLLVGNAIKNGDLPPLETTLDQLFPNQTMAKKLKKVTLEDLLGMTSGFGKIYVEPDSSDKWITKIFNTKPKSKAGKKFRYDDNNSHLIGYLLSKGTDLNIEDYANQIIFKPLGIENYHWEHENGFPKAHTGLSLTARDLLKIGIMVSQNGIWQGQQIIDENWIKSSTSPRKSAHKTLDYGLHWWSLKHHNETYPLAQGAGGQRMYILPEEKIVCIIFGGNFDSWYPLENYIWEIIKK